MTISTRLRKTIVSVFKIYINASLFGALKLD